MTVSQGIRKTISIGLQTGLGVPNVLTGQIMRRKTSILSAVRDMYESDEIVSHHMSTGSAYGLKKPTVKLEGICSALTYQLPFQGLLEKVFVAITPLVLGVDVTTQVAAPQVTDASAGLLAGGIKVGHVGRFTGFTTTAAGNNARNFWVTALTAGQMTGIFLDGGAAMAVKAPETGSVTFTVVGKVCYTPKTGHVLSYYTIEEFYEDTLKSEMMTDSVVAGININLPASGNSSISIDFVGRDRTRATGAQQVATRSVETTTAILAAINGAIYVNGALAGNITGLQISMMNSAADMGAVVASNVTPDIQRGRVKVSGSFTGLFDATTFQDFYDAETNISLAFVMSADNTATSSFLGFTMGRLKITGDAPDDGEKGIVRTYPFTAEICTTGGAALAFDETIITVQDSDAA